MQRARERRREKKSGRQPPKPLQTVPRQAGRQRAAEQHIALAPYLEESLLCVLSASNRIYRAALALDSGICRIWKASIGGAAVADARRCNVVPLVQLRRNPNLFILHLGFGVRGFGVRGFGVRGFGVRGFGVRGFSRLHLRPSALGPNGVSTLALAYIVRHLLAVAEHLVLHHTRAGRVGVTPICSISVVKYWVDVRRRLVLGLLVLSLRTAVQNDQAGSKQQQQQHDGDDSDHYSGGG